MVLLNFCFYSLEYTIFSVFLVYSLIYIVLIVSFYLSLKCKKCLKFYIAFILHFITKHIQIILLAIVRNVSISNRFMILQPIANTY